MSASLKKISLLLITPLLLTTGACGSREDFMKVQNFSKLAEQAVTGFPSLASDFYQSCLRAAHYSALLPAPPETQTVIIRLDNLQKCSAPDKDLPSLTPKLIEANTVLIQYMRGLGKLASDELVDYSADLDGLKTQLGQLPGLNEQTKIVDGAVGIARLLLQAATDGYRREQLKKIIVSSDPYVQQFATSMKTIFADEYIKVFLRNEESKINGYYGQYQQNLLNNQTSGDSQSLTVLLIDLDNQWNKARGHVAEKRELAQSYVDLLNTIAQSHGALSKMYGAGQEPSPETLSKLLNKNTKALEAFVKDFEKVSQNSSSVNFEK